ncbi:hypothetical protein AK88_01634 [Plasmodium fragile]|uniref:Uncharacterized protein n=1 Tax=Plasmodium fragile TaxID=5857 RepID=A0A0D9QPA8_PLAFR|nr:uncharacterized protein AK88_01634 [Plasmodium fragile]KJP88753.1 hypothetical protein AK88_01634 [Plasmodium fragile]
MNDMIVCKRKDLLYHIYGCFDVCILSVLFIYVNLLFGGPCDNYAISYIEFKYISYGHFNTNVSVNKIIIEEKVNFEKKHKAPTHKSDILHITNISFTLKHVLTLHGLIFKNIQPNIFYELHQCLSMLYIYINEHSITLMNDFHRNFVTNSRLHENTKVCNNLLAFSKRNSMCNSSLSLVQYNFKENLYVLFVYFM